MKKFNYTYYGNYNDTLSGFVYLCVASLLLTLQHNYGKTFSLLKQSAFVDCIVRIIQLWTKLLAHRKILFPIWFVTLMFKARQTIILDFWYFVIVSRGNKKFFILYFSALILELFTVIFFWLSALLDVVSYE